MDAQLAVTFSINGRKINISQQIALTIPFLNGGSDKIAYNGLEIPMDLVILYFKWKQSIIRNNPEIPVITRRQWLSLSQFAKHLGDVEFFDSSSENYFTPPETLIVKIGEERVVLSVKLLPPVLERFYYSELNIEDVFLFDLPISNEIFTIYFEQIKNGFTFQTISPENYSGVLQIADFFGDVDFCKNFEEYCENVCNDYITKTLIPSCKCHKQYCADLLEFFDNLSSEDEKKLKNTKEIITQCFYEINRYQKCQYFDSIDESTLDSLSLAYKMRFQTEIYIVTIGKTNLSEDFAHFSRKLNDHPYTTTFFQSLLESFEKCYGSFDLEKYPNETIFYKSNIVNFLQISENLQNLSSFLKCCDDFNDGINRKLYFDFGHSIAARKTLFRYFNYTSLGEKDKNPLKCTCIYTNDTKIKVFVTQSPEFAKCIFEDFITKEDFFNILSVPVDKQPTVINFSELEDYLENKKKYRPTIEIEKKTTKSPKKNTKPKLVMKSESYQKPEGTDRFAGQRRVNEFRVLFSFFR